MPIDQARTLLAALQAAIAAAEASVATEVQFTSHLQALDDQARAELQAAIDARKSTGG